MAEALASKWHKLDFALRLSSHYHQERRRFFARWDNVTMLASLLLSSGAAVSLKVDNCAHSEVALWLAFAVASLQGLSLVIGFGKKASLHGEYCRRFIDLEKKALASSKSQEEFVRMESERRELEKDEPIPMPYLTTRSQIDLMRRDGYPAEEWPRLSLFKRMFAQYLPEIG